MPDTLTADKQFDPIAGKSAPRRERDTVSIHFVLEALAPARAHGHAIETSLREAGIAEDWLAEREARVSVSSYARLWLALARQLDDEFFALDRHALRPGSFHLLCRIMLSARTLAEALRYGLKFLGLVLDERRGHLQHDHRGASLQLQTRQAPATPFADATYLCICNGILSWLAARRLPLASVHFRAPAPVYADEYRLLFGTALHFDAAQSHLDWPPGVLELPVRRDYRQLRRFLCEAPEILLTRYRDPDSLQARVRAHLQALPPSHWPGLELLAQQWQLTPSTMRRHLDAEGQSFQALKDLLRRDMAITRLSHGAASITDIAIELGFTESSAFHRAFRKWTGLSPSAYRQAAQLRAHAAESA